MDTRPFSLSRKGLGTEAKREGSRLQKTKWFGCEVYDVGRCVMLTSFRPLPGEGDAFQRGEGVAIVLLDWGVEA